jgi:hypothetical protein
VPQLDVEETRAEAVWTELPMVRWRGRQTVKGDMNDTLTDGDKFAGEVLGVTV